MVSAGAFREDLYYRLNVIRIRVPPLRERGKDILLLFRHYLEQAGRTHRLPRPDLAPEGAELLLGYGWPGNVRELRNVTERLVLREFPHAVGARDLPREMHEALPRPTAAATPTVPNPAVVGGAATPPPDRPATTGEPVLAASSSPPSVALQQSWQALMAGGSFWAIVHRPFKARELTRADLAALVDQGLRHTRGSYRALIHLFNMPPTDYKRFHAFLYQQNCNHPVGPYRAGIVGGRQLRGAPAEQHRHVG